jgi:DedD protein
VSNALQNRLVGTVILVAVTVIFLPDYLDGKKQTNTETFVDFPRSTSNLTAIAPETFPADEVANATRREVVIVDEQALDAVLESSPSGIDANTTEPSSSNTENDNQAPVEGNAPESSQTAEKLRIAKQMANNIQAAASDENTTDGQSSVNSSQETQGNSLAEQTVVKAVSNNAQDNSGWVVQLGSFGNQKNVNDLLRKLEKAGYRSFSRKVRTSAGQLTKVFVGPELDKDKLDLALPHLKETTGLTGKVTTFNVVSN